MRGKGPFIPTWSAGQSKKRSWVPPWQLASAKCVRQLVLIKHKAWTGAPSHHAKGGAGTFPTVKEEDSCYWHGTSYSSKIWVPDHDAREGLLHPKDYTVKMGSIWWRLTIFHTIVHGVPYNPPPVALDVMLITLFSFSTPALLTTVSGQCFCASCSLKPTKPKGHNPFLRVWKLPGLTSVHWTRMNQQWGTQCLRYCVSLYGFPLMNVNFGRLYVSFPWTCGLTCVKIVTARWTSSQLSAVVSGSKSKDHRSRTHSGILAVLSGMAAFINYLWEIALKS